MKDSLNKVKRFLVPRETGAWADFIPIAYVLAFVVMSVGVIFYSLANYLLNLDGMFISVIGDEDIGTFLMSYMQFSGIWISVILVALIFKRNRPMLSGLAYRRNGNNFRGALIGLILGFLTNGSCILLSCLLGDIKLSFYGFEPMPFFMFFGAIFIQSGSEELLCRLYLYQKLRRGYRQPWVAIVLNAVFFMALHLPNSGINVFAVGQIMCVGVIFGLFVYYYDCLWAAITMHASWNFTQNIIFGLPNSGIVSKYSLFKLDAATAESGLFYDADFGVEGSIGANVILLILCVVILVMAHGKGERRDLWANG